MTWSSTREAGVWPACQWNPAPRCVRWKQSVGGAPSYLNSDRELYKEEVGEAERGRRLARVMSAGTLACLPTAGMQFLEFLSCANGGMKRVASGFGLRLNGRLSCEAGREGLAGPGLERNLGCSPLCKQLHVETSRTGRWLSTIKEAGAPSAVSCFPRIKSCWFISYQIWEINQWDLDGCVCVFWIVLGGFNEALTWSLAWDRSCLPAVLSSHWLGSCLLYDIRMKSKSY